MTDWMVRAATMAVFGRSDRGEGTTEFERMTGETAFDMPAEMAAAMRLMASPATGLMAMSALGFGIAAQSFGLWAGTMTGAVQLSQRLLSASALAQAPAAGSGPAPAPKREKPALTVVAANETPAPAEAPTVAQVEVPQVSLERGTAATPAKRVVPEPVAEPMLAKDVAQSAVRKPSSIERPSAPDDLKSISGIGPKLEKVLNDLGIWTYAQVAAWDKAEVAWMDDHLGFKGRIDRDAWIAQARAMSSPQPAGK
jgi:NADH-quinone oxidoreductase subunit E